MVRAFVAQLGQWRRFYGEAEAASLWAATQTDALPLAPDQPLCLFVQKTVARRGLPIID